MREEPGERAEAEVVCDLQTGRLGGLSEGQGGQGRRWRCRAVDPGVRAEPFGESVQALESVVVGELFPAAGARGGDPEARRLLEGARGADRRGQDRPDGRTLVLGALGGAGVPRGLLWVSAGALGPRRVGCLPGAVLA